MKAKILAIMAVLAVAVAGIAIFADQADADTAFVIDGDEYYVLAVGQTTVDITVRLPAELESALTITASSGTPGAVTIDGSKTIEAGETSAIFTATYGANGSSVITFTATGYESAMVTVYAGVQAIACVPYVIADNSQQSIALAGINGCNEAITAVSSAGAESELGTLTAGTMTEGAVNLTFTPTANFVGSEVITFKCGENELAGQVIVYSDNAAVMGYFHDDTNGLKAIMYSDCLVYLDASEMDLSDVPNVVFRITLSDQTDIIEKTIGPMAAQERMLIEVPGYFVFAESYTTKIEMFNYTDQSIAIATLNGGDSAVSLTGPLTFYMDRNTDKATSPAFQEKYPDGTTETFLERGGEIATDIAVPGFTFLGWTKTASPEDTDYLGLEYTDNVAVEEYLFAVNGNIGTYSDHAETPTTVDNVYVIFAQWSDIVNIKVLYDYNNTDPYDRTTPETPVYKNYDGMVFVPGASGTAPTADSQVAYVINVPSVAKADDSFLLRIQQNPDQLGSYKYTVSLYAKYEWDATLDTPAMVIEESAAVATKITNGLFKIDNLDGDLIIVVKASVASDEPAYGYHFGIDGVSSTEAVLSWDAVDYRIAGVENTLSYNGTYARELEGFGTVYGDFSLLQTGIAYGMIVDGADSVLAADEAVVCDPETGGIPEGAFAGYSFDYTVTLSDGYNIYAVQGVWFDGSNDHETSWNLVKPTA